ncbi:hypothetical protein T07_12722 [Trichinella nelsoni]|uniref:Uncharacterized protein n=1 Tax=Trichinella nelsoni TaxID=6336 RepID=A0A0V0RC19_9BILA|nr:hypothetical protein T07_12722 [Trichinella nelsoni]
MSAVEELYLSNDSRPFCRCAMSYNRFRLFICHATFDNKATREAHKVTYKMAAVRDTWEMFQTSVATY